MQLSMGGAVGGCFMLYAPMIAGPTLPRRGEEEERNGLHGDDNTP